VKIKVNIIPDNLTREIELKPGSKAYDLLKKIQIKPDSVIILKNDVPIPADETIDKDQELKIVKVASGG
jgi:sulfur carrier protein ThiS